MNMLSCMGDNAGFQFPFNYMSVGWCLESMNMKNISAAAIKMYLFLYPTTWRCYNTYNYILSWSLRNLYFIIIAIHMKIVLGYTAIFSQKEQCRAKFIIQYVNCILLSLTRYKLMALSLIPYSLTSFIWKDKRKYFHILLNPIILQHI